MCFACVMLMKYEVSKQTWQEVDGFMYRSPGEAYVSDGITVTERERVNGSNQD